MSASRIISAGLIITAGVCWELLSGCSGSTSTGPNNGNSTDSSLVGAERSPSVTADGDRVYFSISGFKDDPIPHGNLYRSADGLTASPTKVLRDLGMERVSVAPSGSFVTYDSRDSTDRDTKSVRIFWTQTKVDSAITTTVVLAYPVAVNDSIIVLMEDGLYAVNLHTGVEFKLWDYYSYPPARAGDDRILFTGGSMVYEMNVFTGAVISVDTLPGDLSPSYVVRSRDGSLLVSSLLGFLYRFHTDTGLIDTLTDTRRYGQISGLMLPIFTELTDGRIVYTANDLTLWIMNADGRDCRQWVKIPNRVTY